MLADGVTSLNRRLLVQVLRALAVLWLLAGLVLPLGVHAGWPTRPLHAEGLNCTWSPATRTISWTATALNPGYCYRVRVTRGSTEVAAWGPLTNMTTAGGSYVLNCGDLPTGTASVTWNARLDRDQNCDGNYETTNLQRCDMDVRRNVNPVAAGDSGYSVSAGSSLAISAPGVLGNDTDADGNVLTAVLTQGISPAGRGSVTLNADGGFTYVSTAGASGNVTSKYRANDGCANSNEATVTINVTPGNRAPVAVNDSLSTNEDTVLNVAAAAGVLANDRVLVENVNMVKKHQRPNPAKGVTGAIVQKEAPLHVSNIALWDPAGKKPSRVGIRTLEDGRKVRFFKTSGEVVDA